MNDVRFDCRVCKQSLLIDAAAAGMEIRCPSCGAAQTVPAPDSTPPPTEEAATEAAPAPQPQFARRDAAQSEECQYEAFISYRHVEPDRTWAKWLHSAIETYRTPRRLARSRGLPSRLRRVFRDEDELPASADLSREIERALQRSRFLIVICSPRTPPSSWVNAEVAKFREWGRHDQILALLIEGEPSEAFPKALCEIRHSVADGAGSTREQIESVEPLAADVRPRAGETRRQLRRLAKLRMLSCILGVPFDDLRQRERERRLRRLTLAGIAAALLLALMATLLAKTVAMSGLAQQRQQTAAQRLYVSDMLKVQSVWEKADMAHFRDLLNAQRPGRAGAVDLRGFEWFYWWRQGHRELLRLKGHDERVTGVSFSPDGRRLASCSGDVKVWDAVSGKELLTIDGDVGDGNVCFSPDSKRLAAATVLNTLKVWDAASGEELLEIKGHTGVVNSLCFSPDGKRLASCSHDETLKVWDAASGQELLSLKWDSAQSGSSLCFSPDGKRLASAGSAVKVWDAASGKALLSLAADCAFQSVCFSPNGDRIASGDEDNLVRVWDAASGKRLLTLKGHRDTVESVCFSPDGRLLASAGDTVKVWDVAVDDDAAADEDAAGNRELLTIRGGGECVCFSPDGKRLASRGDPAEDRIVKVWDATTGEKPRDLSAGINFSAGMKQPFRGRVVTSPGGQRLALTSEDKLFKVWDAESGRELFSIQGLAAPIAEIWFSPDGKRLASCGQPPENSTVKVWDADSGKELLTLKGGAGCACFSPDGKRLASGGRDTPATVRVWDAETGNELLALNAHQGGVVSVCFSPDGKRLAANSSGRLTVWDAESGKELLAIKTSGVYVTGPCFSPDGTRLALGEDKALQVLDAASGKELLAFKGHAGRVCGLCFSPDGKRLASADDVATVKVWEAATGQELLTLRGSGGVIGFSPDGKRLACGTVIWDAASGPASGENERTASQ